MGPFAMATIIASLAFLAAGIIAPEAADALLRLFLATLAVGYLAARAYEARLPDRARYNAYSPFDGHAAARPSSALPAGLRDLAAELAAADHDRLARRTGIPRSVRWRLMDEAARRLADHHGLILSDPGDHPAVRSLVSEATWSLIAPSVPGPGGGRLVRQIPTLSLSHLPTILDDLEAL